jgi:uncharacterized protein (DUF433 family)/DNA-binding transcriptional MerR regulator
VRSDKWSGFYTIPDVSRLAQIPQRTLYQWQQRGIIAPALSVEEGSRTVHGYTYAQLTIIRIIRAVRTRRLDFKAAGTALMHLYDRFGSPDEGWADQQVYIVGSTIYADRPDDWEVTSATAGGQRVEQRLFGDFFEELRGLEEGESILIPAEYREHVDINPDVMDGEPVLKGTRIPTRMVAALSGAGRSVSDIARMYGGMTKRTVEKAIAYESFLDTSLSAA